MCYTDKQTHISMHWRAICVTQSYCSSSGEDFTCISSTAIMTCRRNETSIFEQMNEQPQSWSQNQRISNLLVAAHSERASDTNLEIYQPEETVTDLLHDYSWTIEQFSKTLLILFVLYTCHIFSVCLYPTIYIYIYIYIYIDIYMYMYMYTLTVCIC